tara:strand:+ start:4286 stop:4555 length:270 start_codon:yes stop_codon:yes gene_type:complete
MQIECPIECVKSGCDDPPDFLTKHNQFIITLSGIISALFGSILAYFLKSRCKKINCFCISCDREIPPIPAPSPQKKINVSPENIEINNI